MGWDVRPGRAGPCRQDAWVSILCQGRDGPHGVERQSQIPAAPTLFPPFCLLTSPGLEGSSGSRARPRQHAALHGTRLSGKGRPSQLCWQGKGGTGHCRKTLPLLQIFTRGAPWVWQEGACFPPPSSSILPGTPCRTPRFPGPVLPVVTGHCNSRETPWWDELQAPLTPQLAALSHSPLPSLAGSCYVGTAISAGGAIVLPFSARGRREAISLLVSLLEIFPGCAFSPSWGVFFSGGKRCWTWGALNCCLACVGSRGR